MSGKGGYNSVTMVDRALQILNQIFIADEPLGVTRLSQDLDLPKATVYRILSTLQDGGFVNKNYNDQYDLGLIFIQYAEKVKGKLSLDRIAAEYMEKLAEDIGETVNLGIYFNGNMVTIYSVKGESSILVSKLIPVAPLNCSSTGKIILANMEEEELIKYFETGNIEKRTRNTITTYEEYIKEREEIRQEEVAYDREEYEYGLSCIAYPVYDAKDEIVAALSISGPTSRLEYKNIASLVEKLKLTGQLINKKIAEAQLK
ncbi:IclR family transcriptional regulator [Vallitalea okinawensis]|uniref:IclR family transcriptional regulator n=1 Tax=Vallitalea okinawensis TaxID=2078660 RepID=UPI00147911A6|nr:IclR family transcriptional regulator [Vallitalea okinawensis]